MAVIVKTIVSGMIRNNTYLVYNEGASEGIIIDPSFGYDKICETMAKNGIEKVTVLLTHGHFDHCASAAKFQKNGSLVYVQKDDSEKTTSRLRSYSSFSSVPFEPFTADVLFEGGETYEIANISVKTLHLKGHSKGGAAFIIENNLFVGDTLFMQSYGRYDFFDGNFDELYNSIVNILFSQTGDFNVFCGHEENTTLDFERKNNEILRDYPNYKAAKKEN